MVMRGNCTFYEKVRLAQIHGAKGLLIVSKDRLVWLLLVLVCQDELMLVTSEEHKYMFYYYRHHPGETRVSMRRLTFLLHCSVTLICWT